MKIGILTYDYAHLKTEQIVVRFVQSNNVSQINLYGLPFLPRPKRSPVFQHRPDMTRSVHPESLATLPRVTFQKWDGYRDISAVNDFFIIGGAGVLDLAFAKGKRIVNAHPGIIPLSRGLDSLKWAIYNGDRAGNTLHVIDNQVDSGEILQIQPTPVFRDDNLEVLARRHYEMEIDMLTNVLEVINDRISPCGIEKPATKRMQKEVELEMISKFAAWKARMLKCDIE